MFPVYHLDPQNSIFHSKEAHTVVRMEAWQQFAHHWTVAKQPKKIPFITWHSWRCNSEQGVNTANSCIAVIWLPYFLIHLPSECQQAKTVLSKKQTSQLKRKSTCPKFHKNLISNCPSPWLLTDMPILTTLEDPNTRFLQMLLLFSIHSGQKLTENLWKTWDFF